jgi:hypothetical protein
MTSDSGPMSSNTLADEHPGTSAVDAEERDGEGEPLSDSDGAAKDGTGTPPGATELPNAPAGGDADSAGVSDGDNVPSGAPSDASDEEAAESGPEEDPAGTM